MKSMFERYPKVFHINTPDQLVGVVNGNHIFCGDVTEYDRSMSKDALDVCFDSAAEFWDPRMVKMARLLMYASYYARPLELDGDRGTWFGNPALLGEQCIAGNRSGHAWTSLIAKGNKVIETLCVFHAMGLNVIGREETFLKAEGPINLINNGDDEVVYTPDESLMNTFEQFRQDKNVGHYLVKREDGAVFSGMMLRKDPDRPLHYIPTPRLHTAFERIYCNERSIGGVMRPRWYIGITERINARDAHPMGGIAWDIHNRLYRDLLEPRFGSIGNILLRAAEGDTVSYSELTAIEREVLESPDKVYYKFTDDQIRKEIMDEIVTKVPVAKFEHIITHHYSGSVH
nr:MAG: RNA-dependent RNA polymerase [Riboviria sp.]